ncbi:hypothetical protein [Streptomyces sp. NBC_00503]|uniref:hypothetical protein n=1 Tax=Streptomyces sp. NBC_00503 TaxID=2903659 RepID=UPI002E80547D|nr:hypothetical protein [Streptomyces sp. NBC_00503]WUD84110.1 hypothetical protein OG490_28135 [Streptomyces sp. NBC_00503]
MLPDIASQPWSGPDFQPEEQAERVSDALRGLPYTSDENIALHPVVVSTEEHDSHYSVVSRFTRLLERTCWEDGTTPYDLLNRLGAAPERHRLLTDSPRERDWAACMSRTDAVVSGGVLRVLECNIGGAIGGPPHIQTMTECHRDAFRGPQGAPLYDAPEPFAARHALYARAGSESADGPPGVALLGSMRDPDYPGRRFFDLEVDYLRSRGMAADFVEPEQLLGPDGGLRHTVVLSHFMQLDWDRLGIDLEPVLEAQRRGAHLLAPESAFLLQNKTVLAWMSCGRPWMSSEDRAFLDRHLPWTREVADEPTRYHGEETDLPRLLRERRNEFVLKPVADYGGHGVVMGCESTQQDWDRAVDRALAEGGHVVQEYARPDSVVVPHYRTSLRRRQDVSVRPVYGFNLFDGKPAGCLVRHAPDDAGGVVNAGLGASINILMHPAN